MIATDTIGTHKNLEKCPTQPAIVTSSSQSGDMFSRYVTFTFHKVYFCSMAARVPVPSASAKEKSWVTRSYF